LHEAKGEGVLMAESTKRHKRERLSVIAEASGCNATYLRVLRKAKETYSDYDVIEKDVWSGELNVSQLNRIITGDTRKGLFVKIQPELHARLKADAEEKGVTMSEYMDYLLTKIFWYQDSE
jgi:hypothetical protein